MLSELCFSGVALALGLGWSVRECCRCPSPPRVQGCILLSGGLHGRTAQIPSPNPLKLVEDVEMFLSQSGQLWAGFFYLSMSLRP